MDPPPHGDPYLQPQGSQAAPSYDPYYYYSYYQQPLDGNQHYAQPQPQSQPYAADPYYHHAYDAYYQPLAPPQPQPVAPPAVPYPPGAEPPAAAPCQKQPEPAAAAQPGINPAAEAAIKALSELTQFADRMCAEERARAGVQWHERSRGMVAAYGTHSPGAPPYPAAARAPAAMHMGVGGRNQRGRGRRGGGLPRGGGSSGRGGFNPNVNGQDGRSPTFRGRGRRGRGGRGRGEHQELGQESSSAQTPVLVSAPPPRPIVVAWCDICRVDCNSLEILEQHKNGKRHKKTVQKLEEMQARQKLIAELEAKRDQEKLDEKSTEQNVGAVFEKETMEQPSAPTVPKAGADDAEDSIVGDGTAEAKEVDNVEMPEEANTEPSSEMQPGQLQTKPMRGGYGRSRLNRGGSVRIGRAGKRLRNTDLMPNKQPKRPKEMPLFCNVCTVTCDTQAVFERHLAGKKHLSKISRFPGHVGAFIPSNHVLDAPSQQVLSAELQPNDGAAGVTAPESTNFQNQPAAQLTTGDHPDNDKTEAGVPTTFTSVQENATASEHAALPGSDASNGKSGD